MPRLSANAHAVAKGLPLVLLLALASPQRPAAAQPSPALPASVLEAEQQHERVLAHQQRLEGILAEQSARIARLKRQQQGLQRDAQLQRALREAQSVAARLDALQQGSVKRARARLEQTYRQALAAPIADRGLRARLLERQARLRARASRAPTRIVVGVTADPLDDADDLETKADLLRDSADKVERELRAVRTQLATLERRATLQRHQAAASSDLFIEEAPRWVAQARSSVSASTTPEATSSASDSPLSPLAGPTEGQPSYARPDTATDSAGPAALGAPSSSGNVLGTYGAANANAAPRGPGGPAANIPLVSPPTAPKGNDRPAVGVSGAGGPAAPPTLVTTTTVTLASVLDPATLRELEQALRSGNASAHADALRRAAQRLEQLAGRLKLQSQALRRDAARERRAP